MEKTYKIDKTAFTMGSHSQSAEHQYAQWRKKNAEELFDEVQQLILNFYDASNGVDKTIFNMRKHEY